MIYNLILVLSLPFILPLFLVIAAFNPRYRVGLLERLGFWSLPTSHSAHLTSHFPLFWVHAASVGEVQAAWPLVEELRRRYPPGRFLFTTLTVTGRSLLRQKRADTEGLIYLFPVDLPGIAARLMRRIKPDLVLVVETELWPNFIRAAHRQGIPVVIVNGRISPRTFARYRMIRLLLGPALSSVKRFLMQTKADAERIIRLGAPPHRVEVTGNLKFDQRPQPLSEPEKEALRSRWGWKASDPIWVAGSTHDTEEERLVSVFMALKEDYPDLRLILAPRHPERIEEVIKLLHGYHLAYGLSSEANPHLTPPFDVLLVNTVGELPRLYSLAHLVFVGGSLVPVGGHNLAEPALLGKPVLFGPHTQQVQAMADLLMESGGGILVKDTPSLEKAVRIFLEDPGLAARLGRQAREAIAQHQSAAGGAVQKTAWLLSDLISQERPRRIYRLDRRSGIERWFQESLWPSRGGGLTRLAALILAVLSTLYQGVLHARGAAYQVGVLRSKRLERPVISVGNLTVGGTGKTPTVMAICRLLLRSGLRPVVLSRGYGGRARSSFGRPVLAVSDGKTVRLPPDLAGDEPVLLALRLPGVPVLIGADRAEAGQAAVADFRPDVLVLDDGFQHLKLRRDLDLVLLDATDPFGNGWVLPRGPLREPIAHLKRAHALLLTQVRSPEAAQRTVTLLQPFCPDRPCLLSRHQLTGFIHLGRLKQKDPQALESLSAKRIFIVAGIARPETFLHSIISAGLEVTGAWIGPDHYRFRPQDVAIIEREAERLGAHVILTTEKDAVRLQWLGEPLEAWWAATMELQVFDQKAWEDLILNAVRRQTDV